MAITPTTAEEIQDVVNRVYALGTSQETMAGLSDYETMQKYIHDQNKQLLDLECQIETYRNRFIAIHLLWLLHRTDSVSALRFRIINPSAGEAIEMTVEELLENGVIIEQKGYYTLPDASLKANQEGSRDI